MRLLKKGKRPYDADEDEILQRFAESEIFKNDKREEKVRLALFIGDPEPAGLDSNFKAEDFLRLWDYWCENKFKYMVKEKA